MRHVLALEASREGTCLEAAVARTKFHLAMVLQQQQKNPEEARGLAETSRMSLSSLIKSHPLDALKDVKDKHELALFDHLQPVFDGRFTGRDILPYLSE
jgi:hypothetical protein